MSRPFFTTHEGLAGISLDSTKAGDKFVIIYASCSSQLGLSRQGERTIL